MNVMNIFDLTYALLLGWAIFTGARRGLVMQVTSVLALLLGIYAAFRFSYLMARWVTSFGVGAEAVSILSFALTFIGVVVAARLLGSVADRAVRVALLGWLNRLLGMVFSVVGTTLIVSVVLFIINSVERSIKLLPPQLVEQSRFYAPVSGIVPRVLPYLDFEKMVEAGKRLDGEVEKEVKKNVKRWE